LTGFFAGLGFDLAVFQAMHHQLGVTRCLFGLGTALQAIASLKVAL
jgi:hypothetical protein